MTDFFKKSTYAYDLPPELIAQVPVTPRDSCRLLDFNRQTSELNDCVFHDIITLLNPGDLIVRNDTRVMPARLFGTRPSGGVLEALLLRPLPEPNSWEALLRPSKKCKPGTIVSFGNVQALAGEVLSEDGTRRITFEEGTDVDALMHRQGELPLPPYITSRASNAEDYQTVYSREEKSAAAPTAGLHFTEELFNKLDSKGVNVADLTLEVGLGTFRPLSADDIRDHVMHYERCFVPQKTVEAIRATKKAGGRVIALGTTVTRTLEAYWRRPCNGWFETDLFIFPGYQFGVIDALITNFHLPESTLLMLVSAFAGYDATMAAYRHAVREKYRFFSFGDAMFIH